MNNAALTAMLSKPMFDVKNAVVPGAKSTKHKKERDLIVLADYQLCLFTAEADVEDVVKISNKVLRTKGRVTVRSDIQVEKIYNFR